MTEETHPLATFTDENLEALLHRAIRNTLVFGLVSSLIVWKAAGWRNAAMLAVGTAISAASITEWRRMVRLVNAKLDRKQAPRGAAAAAVFFVLRVIIFGAIIYGSLKCFQGSWVALLCGLGLSVLAMVWEAISLLRE